jgi:hypothetical protein
LAAGFLAAGFFALDFVAIVFIFYRLTRRRNFSFSGGGGIMLPPVEFVNGVKQNHLRPAPS